MEGGGGGGGDSWILLSGPVHYSYMYMHVLYSLGEVLSFRKVQVFGFIFQAFL